MYPARLIGSFSSDVSVATTEITACPLPASFSRIFSKVAPVALPTNNRGTRAAVELASMASALGIISSSSNELTTITPFAPPSAAIFEISRSIEAFAEIDELYHGRRVTRRVGTEHQDSEKCERTLVTFSQECTHSSSHNHHFAKD